MAVRSIRYCHARSFSARSWTTQLTLHAVPLAVAADDHDTQIRLLDLELQVLGLRQQAIDAELSHATRERWDRFQQPERIPFVPAPMPMDMSPAIPYAEPPRSMRPPWLQPADPWVPMPDEDRATVVVWDQVIVGLIRSGKRTELMPR